MNSSTVTPSVIYDDASGWHRLADPDVGACAAVALPDAGWHDCLCRAGLAYRRGIRFQSPACGQSVVEGRVASIALAAPDAETVRRHFHQAVAAGADVVRDLHVSRTPPPFRRAAPSSICATRRVIFGQSAPTSPRRAARRSYGLAQVKWACTPSRFRNRPLVIRNHSHLYSDRWSGPYRPMP